MARSLPDSPRYFDSEKIDRLGAFLISLNIRVSHPLRLPGNSRSERSVFAEVRCLRDPNRDGMEVAGGRGERRQGAQSENLW